MEQRPPSDLWDTHLSSGARSIVSSAIRDLLRVTEQPDMISFAGGLPAAEYFPADALAAAAAQVLAASASRALQYGPTEGYSPLRDWLAGRMHTLGVPAPADQIVVTSGSQQGLDLLGKLLIDPGDVVVVEEPTYLGALQAWRPYRPRFVALPLDEQGLRVDALEQLLRQGVRPRFLYVVSSFQNPTGTTLSAPRRQALVELATRFSLPIVEDDPYGDLCYDDERAPLLAALEWALHGELRHVVYLSTFSKLLAPGLRVAWMAAHPSLLRRLVHAKQGLDLHASSLGQAVAHEAIRESLLDHHVPLLRRVYAERRDTMLRALEREMPAGTRWTRPGGGMFVWVTLPPGLDAAQLLPAALEQRVAFVPGAAFFANGGGANTLRLNFSFSDPRTIEEGVRRLGRVLRAMAS